MNDLGEKVSVAVVQAAPYLFNRKATLEKLRRLTMDASKQGAQLVLFPEAFVPAYPRGLNFGVVVGSRIEEGRKLWARYWLESLSIPGPYADVLSQIAKAARVYLAVGVIERDAVQSGGTLYCTLVYFGPDGSYLGKHRKIKPTAAERYIWGEGDGSTLDAIETPFGVVGGLICWENYMPLARAHMYAQGVTHYLAPTADARESWQATMRHLALEGRCFVLSCNQFVTKSMYPEDLRGELENEPEVMSSGGSVIVSPLGEIMAGPLEGEEGTLYAELDPEDLLKARFDFDPVGHYARPDIFKLQVNKNEISREAEEESEDNPAAEA